MQEQLNILQKDSVVLCGIVVTELYRGIKNKKEEKAVEEKLQVMKIYKPYNSLDISKMNVYY